MEIPSDNTSLEKRVCRGGYPELDELVACAMQLPGQDPAYRKRWLRDTHAVCYEELHGQALTANFQ